MTVSELKSRLTTLERRVDQLQNELEQERMMKGVQRGLDAMDAGRVSPAREVIEKLRKKQKIPSR
jgi:predicted transcriptional regulator